MKIMLRFWHLLLFAGIIVFSFFLVAKLGLATSPFDIRFPIPELDNCANEQECRAYCDDRANIKACVAFAQKHGLIPAEVVARADKFADALNQGGPGNCRTPAECEAYCGDLSHIEECISFAERYGVKPPHELEEARKVASALKKGAKLPGDCRSKDDCERYCENPDHGEECLAFAEAAGFIPPEERERARKFMDAMRQEGGPGGCRSPMECQRFCENPDNFEACVSFGERYGMIPPEEAAIIKKTGGKGPGGCRGPQECGAYCNNPEHQEECFRFAQEHGLIRQEELANIREGVGRMRMGLEQAPPEVTSCIEEALGEDVLEKIEAGLLLPGPRLGEQMRSCFERFRPQIETKVQSIFEGAPLEIRSCLEENLGSEVVKRMKRGEPPTPELGDKMRFCFERFRSSEAGPPPVAAGLFEHAPDEVRACLKRTVGEEVIERLRAGEPPSGEVGEKMRACFENYRPSLPPRVFEQIPPDIKVCLEEKLGAGVLERLLTGEHPSPEIWEKKRECFEKYQPTYMPGPRPGPTICPAMPTVDTCPAGQRKEAVFSSPECGTYYTCVPEGQPSPFPSQPPATYPQGYVSEKGIPAEILSCVQERFGAEFIQRWQRGEVTFEEWQQKTSACLPGLPAPLLPGTFQPPPPTSLQSPTTAFPQPSPQICIQVITPARDPVSGACRDFPTPCDVPAGWERVDRCAAMEPSSALPLRTFLANILSTFGILPQR